jgi:hypothetical protein
MAVVVKIPDDGREISGTAAAAGSLFTVTRTN